MKKFYYTRLSEEQRDVEFALYPGFAEWKDTPEEVLKQVDHLLKLHGLEIHIALPGDTTTLFKIERRKKS